MFNSRTIATGKTFRSSQNKYNRENFVYREPPPKAHNPSYCVSTTTTANPANDYLTSLISQDFETDHSLKKFAHYVPKTIVTDITSLVSKVKRIQEFINRNQISIVIVTETWLRSTIMDSVVDITGYSLIRKDRSSA